MPKTQEAPSRILLSDEEKEIVQHAWDSDSFRETCWDQYGPEWVNHIPLAINAFIWYYFGIRLFPWQLAIYYAPQTEITAIGGRGSGKTMGIGIAMAAYHALHPGEPWLHVSPVKDQAQRTYEAIMQYGSVPHGNRPTFVSRFVRDYVVAPFPEIRLKSWDSHDPGNILRFRPLGDDNIEYLRSMEAGTITVDEAFRDVENPATYPQLRGCIRGMNTVRMALMPKNKQEKIDKLIQQISMESDDKTKNRLERELDNLVEDLKLKRRNLMLLYGNVAGWMWVKRRYEQARRDPQNWFSLKVTSYDNPTLGRDAVKGMERAYGDGELRGVEMNADWPSDVGNIFSGRGLMRCLDPNALAETLRAYEDDIPGYMVRNHLEHGIFMYQEPSQRGHVYVIGADPGSGMIPDRNKWCIVTFDMSVTPFRMTYFEVGNVDHRQRGSFSLFWNRLRYCRDYYPGLPGDVWVESTGPQRGMNELAMPEDVRVTAVSLQTTKLILVNKWAALIDRGMLSWPDISIWTNEHSAYNIPDDQLDQDCVMAGICAGGAMWQYVDIDYQPREVEYAEAYPEDVVFDRNARPLERPQDLGRSHAMDVQLR